MSPVTRGVLFDLDGTLADTLDDIAGAMNHVLRERGMPTHGRDAYRDFVGSGVEALVRRAAPSADADPAELTRAFRARYGKHMFDRTRPYPGVPDALRDLASRGVPMAVLSNKPHEPTRAMVARLFPEVPFREVRGARPGATLKPDPASALELAEVLGLAPAEVAYVGDTKIDMETACRAGMVPVGVLWGFRRRDELEAHGARRLLHHPRDLTTLC
ncbi:MAG: HAD family hydrolase [Myxococcota bacterium]